MLPYFLYALLFTSLTTATPLPQIRNIARGYGSSPKLRILPLGDSITWGYLSSDGNGYREQLVSNLNATGNEVLVVGSHKHGTMWDPWNAGYSGYTISQIQDQLPLSTDYRPNVILVHAGTNDLNANPLNQTFDEAIDRLGGLLDACHDACPDALILLAQITGTANAEAQTRTDDFNSKIPGLVSQKQASGFKILSVDFQSIKGDLLQDGLHPTDDGYKMMGDIWSKNVDEAKGNGFISDPVTNDPDLDLSPSTA